MASTASTPCMKEWSWLPDLVAPSTEATTRVDIQVLELGEELLEDALTLERRSGVTVVELAVVSRDDLVLGLEHLVLTRPWIQSMRRFSESTGFMEDSETSSMMLQ